jgi:hypothetical protein
MAKLTDAELKGMVTNPEKAAVKLGQHFHMQFPDPMKCSWIEIAEEALRMNNIMFGEQAQSNDPRAFLLDAVAAHATFTAFGQIANMLGVNSVALSLAAEEVRDSMDLNGAPLPYDQFITLCREKQQWMDHLSEMSTSRILTGVNS